MNFSELIQSAEQIQNLPISDFTAQITALIEANFVSLCDSKRAEISSFIYDLVLQNFKEKGMEDFLDGYRQHCL